MAFCNLIPRASRPVARPGPAMSLVRGWQGTNFRGQPVSLLAGPAVTAVALGTSLLGTADGSARTVAVAPAFAVGSVGLLAGRLDDLYGGPDDRGLHGHLMALAGGRVTTGTVKAVLLALAAAGASGGSAGTSASSAPAPLPGWQTW